MTQNERVPTLSWQNRAKGLASNLINFVFPPRCAACNSVGSLLCTECQNSILWMEEPLCSKCGRDKVNSHAVCHACEKRPLPLQQIRAATLFEDPISKIIHHFKYNGQFGLAAPLAEVMLNAWPKWQTAVHLIMPIPLHPERKKSRGYNQAALLSEKFGKKLCKQVDQKSLQRIRNTPSQVNLTAIERQKNMMQAFSYNGPDLTGKQILLVDDVCTTGATMASAAEVLIDAGATSVAGYCVARAM